MLVSAPVNAGNSGPRDPQKVGQIGGVSGHTSAVRRLETAPGHQGHNRGAGGDADRGKAHTWQGKRSARRTAFLNRRGANVGQGPQGLPDTPSGAPLSEVHAAGGLSDAGPSGGVVGPAVSAGVGHTQVKPSGGGNPKQRSWVPARKGWEAAKGAADKTTVTRSPAPPGPTENKVKTSAGEPAAVGPMVPAGAAGVPAQPVGAAPIPPPAPVPAVVAPAAAAVSSDVAVQCSPVAGVAVQADMDAEEADVFYDVVVVDKEPEDGAQPVIPLLFPSVLVTSGYVVPTLRFERIYRTADVVHGVVECAVMRYKNDRPSRGPVVWDVKTLSTARYVTGDLLFQREGVGEDIVEPLSGWQAVVGEHWLCGEVTMRLGPAMWVGDADGGRFCLRVLEGFEDPQGIAGLLTAAAEVWEGVLRSGVSHVFHVVRPLPDVRRHLGVLGGDAKAIKARYSLVQAQCSAGVYPVYTTYMHEALKHPETAPDPVLLREQLERVVGELQLSQKAAP